MTAPAASPLGEEAVSTTTAGTGYLVCASPWCRGIVGVSAPQVWHGRGMQSGLPRPGVFAPAASRGRFQVAVVVTTGNVKLSVPLALEKYVSHYLAVAPSVALWKKSCPILWQWKI